MLEIGKRSGANFNDDQRKVLSGELAKLKMKEEGQRKTSKPVVGSKEEAELKKIKRAMDTAVTNANKSLIDHRSWVPSTDRTDLAKTKKLSDSQ